jgi:hypothetical protein
MKRFEEPNIESRRFGRSLPSDQVNVLQLYHMASCRYSEQLQQLWNRRELE